MTVRAAAVPLLCLVLLSIAQPSSAVAQTNAPAPLAPAAQEALDKGVIAAKVPDYPLAIRYIEDARKLAPNAPVIYLNMGLAESRIPGRELRAIAWLGAYLAAYPNAPNAAAVKEQIAVLDVRNQSNVSRLIKSIEDPPIQTTSPNELMYTVEQINLSNLRQVVTIWARAGDIKAALRIAERITGDDYYAKTAHAAIAEAQAKPRDAIVTVSDWLEMLDMGRDCYWDFACALNSEPFLDLARYLKSLPPPKNSQAAFEASAKTARILATAQSVIHRMLKQQAKQ